MNDPFLHHEPGLHSPGERHAVITASQSEVVPRPRALRFGGDGTVTVEDRDGTAVTYTVSTGEIMPFRAVKITATTVSQIVGWW